MTKGDDTRTTILDHATRKAARVGLTGLTIGALAKELKMSKSGLYSHFRSKEALQVQIIEHGAEHFTDLVIRPALKFPRGEPRLRALVENWLNWLDHHRSQCGCLFIAAASELDDRPGPARDRLVDQQRDLIDFVTSITRVAVDEGHFRADLDATQFAHECYGIVLAFHHSARLMRDPKALERTRTAFERLLVSARTPDPR